MSVKQDDDSIYSDVVRGNCYSSFEKEVNEGKNFAPLRQIYHSLMLAAWYKRKIKDGLLEEIYVDQKKIKGVDLRDKTQKSYLGSVRVESF